MSAAQKLRATLDGVLDQVAHPLDVLRPDERTDVGRRVAAWAQTQLLRFLHAVLGKLFRNLLLDKQALNGQADLPAICVTAPNGCAGCYMQVRVCKDNHCVLAAQFKNRRYELRRASFGNAPASGHAARKHDFVRSGVDQCLSDFAAALHDGDKVLRESGVAKEPLDERTALRRKVAGLADHSIPRHY